MNRNISSLLLIILLTFIASCKKDTNVNSQPKASSFTAELESSGIVPASGATVNIAVKAGANGWWVQIPAGASWCTISRQYGSGDFALPVKLAANTSGIDRSVSVILNSTFNIAPVMVTISQAE